MTITPEEVARLAADGEPRCAKCGNRRSEHNYRHPFQSSHPKVLEAAAHDMAALIAEQARELEDLRAALGGGPMTSVSGDLVKRLRNTPNWMREEFQDWKDNVRTYDRAPFEAADRIEELEAENHLLKTSGIIEVAVRNPNVMEYMRHWEGRAAAAEAALEKAMKIAEDYEGNEDHNSYSVSRFIYELEAKLKTAEEIGRAFEEDAGQLRAQLEKAVETIDDLISTYVWVREDEYDRGWSEMSNAVHEATFVQMELKGQKK